MSVVKFPPNFVKYPYDVWDAGHITLVKSSLSDCVINLTVCVKQSDLWIPIQYLFVSVCVCVDVSVRVCESLSV